MMYVLLGGDHTKISQRLTFLRTAANKKGLAVESLSGTTDEIITTLSGASLFGETSLYVMRDVLDDPTVFDYLLSHPEKKVIVAELKVTPTQKKQIQKSEHMTLEEFKKAAGRDNRIFDIANALRDRDPKNGWMTYRELLDEGYVEHQIMGTMWWQIKSLLAVHASPKDHGLKPFVATQAARGLKNYPNDSLIKKSIEFVDMYHRGHVDGKLESRIEEFMLGLKK